jgi:hypothetical protein
MSVPDSPDIIIRIDSIDQLFNDSSIQPFSDKPIVILGEAGLPYAIRQAMSHALRGWRGKRLIIQLPHDQVTSGLQTRVDDAVRRYAREKLNHNNALIRLSRVRALIGLVFAIGIAAVLLTILMVVSATLLTSASDTVKGVFAGLITIFIWSTVWNPWDRLIYEWIEPWRENRILNNLLTMDIIVQAEPNQP